MMDMYSKHWNREVEAELTLPDGHQLRLAVETRRPEWVRFHERASAQLGGSGWDGVPESRVLLMHDDWPDREKRLRTARKWHQQVDFDANHVNGLVWLVEQLGERNDELPPLLCSEFVEAFENTLEGIFSDCAFFLPHEDSAEFVDYTAIYLEPALEWLLACTSETFDLMPILND